MNSPLEKPKHIKQLQLSADKNCFPQCAICYCFDFHAVQLLHTIFLTSSLPQLLFCIILTWILRLFPYLPVSSLSFFSRPISFLQTHPQDIPPSFLFNTEKHNSHDQWISLLQIHSALTLSLCLLNSSSTPKLILFPTLSEHLHFSPINSPSLMQPCNPDGYFSSNRCRCTPSLQRSHLYPIYLSFLPHPCLWPKKSTQSIILRILFVSITQNTPPALSLHRSCQPLFLKLHGQDNST